MPSIRFPIREFLRKHSIQRSNQFLVDFNMAPSTGAVIGVIPADVNKEGSILKVYGAVNSDFPIKEYNIDNITLPSYTFKKEIQKMGPFTKVFPVFENEGVQLTLLLKEDEEHNVGKFITYLQKRIINEDGLYVNPSVSLINSIDVTILNNVGEKIVTYHFKECFYLSNTEPNYDYSNNGYISTALTMGANYYTLEIF